MEVDRETTMTVMSEAICAAMKNSSPRQKSNTKLHTCTRDKLNVSGMREINIDNQHQHYKLPVIVVTSKDLKLLGKNWLNVIKLDWTQMFYQEEGNNKHWQWMTDQYPEVFHEELGIMKEVKTYIQVPEGAIPRYFKPRPLTLTLQGPVVWEIE